MDKVMIVLKTIFVIIDLALIYSDGKILKGLQKDVIRNEDEENVVFSLIWKGIILLFLIIIA